MTLTVMVLLLPLASFLLACIIPGRFSRAVSAVSSLFVLTSFVCASTLLTREWNGAVLIHIHWFTLGDYSLSANLALTNTSLLMMSVVSFISLLVHVYSTGYMAGDLHFSRYFAMLGFFTFSMQGIVLADNLLILFIFWELVGFSSYMLVGHWMERPAAARAARKAFLVNRIGDGGFLIGLMLIWSHTGHLEISEFFSKETDTWQTAAALCILCGVAGKSAQFPLFTWLPDAMEGPTPVSALIHAATMVAAGVYLLIRMLPVFTPDALTVVACVGMITSVIGSLTALFQFDIKKVLAYSTISQLGLMVMAIGLGNFNAALLHLYTHAFFKACLFLSAGNVIHALHHAQQKGGEDFDVQDIRNMGGLRKKIPVTFFSFLLGGASLAGIPFFSGFLSKEAILTAVWMNSSMLSWLMLATLAAVSFITVLYTFRMIWYVFMGEERKKISATIHEAPLPMQIPVVLLALCSLWLVVSWNPFDFIGWLLPASHFTHLPWITVFSLLWIIMALIIGYFVFRTARFDSNKLLENGFYFDLVTRRALEKIALSCAGAAHHIDKKWIDGFIHGTAYAHVSLAHITGWVDRALVDGTVNGIASISKGLGSFTRSFQGGKIQLYIFWAILAIIIFLIWTLN
jgi:NADH-quinone oxidoreductase subunit L